MFELDLLKGRSITFGTEYMNEHKKTKVADHTGSLLSAKPSLLKSCWICISTTAKTKHPINFPVSIQC